MLGALGAPEFDARGRRSPLRPARMDYRHLRIPVPGTRRRNGARGWYARQGEQRKALARRRVRALALYGYRQLTDAARELLYEQESMSFPDGLRMYPVSAVWFQM
ncbi:hypothetical protein GCM10018953_70710 [Streptosporangium nondiastaticum]